MSPDAPVGPEPSDENVHEPGPEPLWNESWYFDFTDEAGTLGGYVRLGLYPNLGVAWYWACLVGEGRPLTTVLDHEVPLPTSPRSLAVRAEGLWADHTVEAPLDHMSLACEAFATALDDPAQVYARAHGDRVPFGLDLEWETDGRPYAWPGVARYEVPCRVSGEVLVGSEALELDGWGQRDHSWGVRDWWEPRWLWTAGRLRDGTRFHAGDVAFGDARIYATGYVQHPGSAPEPATPDRIDHGESLGPDGLPAAGDARIGPLDLAVEPVAFAPVLLVAPDGRVSRLPRALCRFTDRPTGRTGAGWTEWTQPQAGCRHRPRRARVPRRRRGATRARRPAHTRRPRRPRCESR
ncbi:MAG: hypothetical protein HYX34_01520 [Actinobacteria bacterium]|nr:hypothetical protein [Actinomycetota bacterium]